VGDRKSLSRHGERITESCLNVFTEERLRYHSSVNRLRLLFVDILNSAWKTSFLWGVHFSVQGHLNLLPLERAQLPPDGARAARRSAHASWKPSSGASKLGPDPVESIAGGGPHHAGLYQCNLGEPLARSIQPETGLMCLMRGLLVRTLLANSRDGPGIPAHLVD
jgi:hypothetical protein